MIKGTILFISIIPRLKSDWSATSLRWMFAVSLLFSEKQMEEGEKKTKKTEMKSSFRYPC